MSLSKLCVLTYGCDTRSLSLSFSGIHGKTQMAIFWVFDQLFVNTAPIAWHEQEKVLGNVLGEFQATYVASRFDVSEDSEFWATSLHKGLQLTGMVKADPLSPRSSNLFFSNDAVHVLRCLSTPH